jgi:hypothetical protein
MKSLLRWAVIAMVFPSWAAHELILADFSNKSSRTELSSIATPMQEVLSAKFSPYGIRGIDRTQDPSRQNLVSTQSRTLIRGELIEGDTLLLRFTLEIGDDRRMVVKEAVYNPLETLDQNLTVISVKILHALEENVLSRVQIVSDPSITTLSLDNRIQSETPWESYLSNGRHSLHLSLAGYLPLEKEISVAPGNNRFTFVLVPVKLTDSVTASQKEMKAFSHKRAYLALAVGLLCSAAGVAFQTQYTRTDDKYDHLISRNTDDYSSLHSKAENYLVARNISLGVGGIALGFAAYQWLFVTH